MMIKILEWKIRKLGIQLFNWEFMPHAVVYTPLYFYWFWLSLKARSFFFFNTANPLIENGGFLMESKNDVYKLIPERYYPATIFCKAGAGIGDIRQALPQKGISYPLIAKPDIGQKGLGVSVIQSEKELCQYYQFTAVDFLVQSYIDYPNEAGIFYYRMPNEKKGHISGIVKKEFLSVRGDGVSTIEELVWKEKRHLLQWPALKKTYGDFLQTVLPPQQERVLIPYGNHSRGAKFTDVSEHINEALVKSIDSICQEIPGFYYGRLDIRFSNWEDLCAGKNFSIIELNGSGSEPTHIYDPGHSIFFAWKEVARHWNILYHISRFNAKHQSLTFMSIGKGLKMFKQNAKHVKLLTG